MTATHMFRGPGVSENIPRELALTRQVLAIEILIRGRPATESLLDRDISGLSRPLEKLD